MMILQECRSVQDFNHTRMIHFVRENTSIPTGAMQKYLIHYALLTYAKSAEEQGKYAARTALKILDGADPKSIPVVSNKQGSIYLNMKLAKRLGNQVPDRVD